MCVKIICTDHEHEFKPEMPLEQQIVGARAVVVNYSPVDPTISNVDRFIDEMERLCKDGISCNIDILVNANNYLKGLVIERQIEKIKKNLDINEVVKGLTKFHSETDSRLKEIASMCLGENNE